jgi:hypothetical protein
LDIDHRVDALDWRFDLLAGQTPKADSAVWKMKAKGNIAAVVLVSCFVAGCTTPYLAEQQELALKKDRGEIT